MPEWKAAVDLTSRDLQTGTIQLPGRLDALPPAGVLPAVDAADDTRYSLHLEAPRELRGLGPYFEVHALRTNDAISLVFEKGQLTLDAIRRQRRHAGTTASMPRPAAESEPEAVEQEDTEPAESDPPTAEPVAAFGNDPEPRNGAIVDPLDPADRADPFAGFTATDDFEPFEDGDDLDISSLGTDHDTPAVQVPAGLVVDATAPPAEPTEAPEPQHASAGQATDSYYTLPYRRPFRAHAAQSLPQHVTLSPVVENALSRLEEVMPESEAQQAEATSGNLASETHTGGATGPQGSEVPSAVEQLQVYLTRPDLPAIIRVSLLAVELGVDAEELASAVTAYAQEPEARLTYVRPDYYLFKRTRE